MGKTKGKQEEATASGAAEGDVGEPTDLKRLQDRILEAITATREALHDDIAQVASGLGLLRADHDKLKDRVTETEGALKILAPAHKTLEGKLTEALDRIQVLERRAEDAENRSRRSNVRIVGMPESEGGTDLLAYCDNWLRTVVAPEGLSPFFTLERAHRVPSGPPKPGLPPRPIVAKLLHYRDRDLLLQRARDDGPYQIANSRVTLFPDFTFETQKQRASFLSIKKELRTEGIHYSLLFPARLRIVVDDKTMFFNLAADAWDWWESYKAGTDGAKVREEKERERERAPAGPRQSQRLRKRRRGAGKPTASQAEAERKAALQAVITIGEGGGSQSTRGTDTETIMSASGSESDLSGVHDAKDPVVTPQTAEEILNI